MPNGDDTSINKHTGRQRSDAFDVIINSRGEEEVVGQQIPIPPRAPEGPLYSALSSNQRSTSFAERRALCKTFVRQ